MIHVPKPTYLSIPKRYRPAIRAIYKKGLTQTKAKIWNHIPTQEQVLEGFRQRYTSPPETWQYIDGVMDWYMAPLYHFESAFLDRFKNSPETHVVDIGCGIGSVCRWLRDQDYAWHYTGYDPVEECAPYFEKYDYATFITKAAEDLNTSDFKTPPDFITAVNVFCYIPHPIPVLRTFRKAAHDKTMLVLIDAYPSAFWAPSIIGGDRKPEEFQELLHQSGWRISRQCRLSAHVAFNIPFITISQAYLCTPR